MSSRIPVRKPGSPRGTSPRRGGVATPSRETPSRSLYRSVLDQNRTNDSNLRDVSNTLNASVETTDRKKGRALAEYKKFIEEITPRTAIENFIQATEEDAVSLSEYFPSQKLSQRSNEDIGNSYTRGVSAINASTVISDISNFSVTSTESTGTPPPSRSSRKSRPRSVVSAADLDPERDITRPTDTTGLPPSPNNTTGILTPSLDETMMPPARVPRRRRKKAEDNGPNPFSDLEDTPDGSKSRMKDTFLDEKTPAVKRKRKRARKVVSDDFSVPNITDTSFNITDDSANITDNENRAAESTTQNSAEYIPIEITSMSAHKTLAREQLVNNKNTSREQSIREKDTSREQSVREKENNPNMSREQSMREENNATIGREQSLREKGNKPLTGKQSMRENRSKPSLNEPFDGDDSSLAGSRKRTKRAKPASVSQDDFSDVGNMSESSIRVGARRVNTKDLTDAAVDKTLTPGSDQSLDGITPLAKKRRGRPKKDYSEFLHEFSDVENQSTTLNKTKDATLNKTKDATLNKTKDTSLKKDQPSVETSRELISQAQNESGEPSTPHEEESPKGRKRGRSKKDKSWLNEFSEVFDVTGDELDTSLILSKQTPKSAKIADQNTSKPGGQTLKSASTVGQDKSTVNQDRNNVDGNESGGAGAEISSLVLTPTPKARKRNRRRDKIITSADFSLSQTNATAGQSELQVRKAFVLDGSLPSFLKDSVVDESELAETSKRGNSVHSGPGGEKEKHGNSVHSEPVGEKEKHGNSVHSEPVGEKEKHGSPLHTEPAAQVENDNDIDNDVVEDGNDRTLTNTSKVIDEKALKSALKGSRKSLVVSKAYSPTNTMHTLNNSTNKEASLALEFSPIVNTPSPSARHSIRKLLAQQQRDAEDKEAQLEEQAEEEYELGEEEKDKLAHFEETKVRRAARKSLVLGHFVRAPNLSNIAETSEFPSTGRSKSAGLSRGPTPNPGGPTPKPDDQRSSVRRSTNPEDGGSTDRGSTEGGSTERCSTEQREARKSVYYAGMPDLPRELEITGSFSPNIDSTRIGNMTGLADVSPVVPLQHRDVLKFTTPGAVNLSRMNTSTPDLGQHSGANRSASRRSLDANRSSRGGEQVAVRSSMGGEQEANRRSRGGEQEANWRSRGGEQEGSRSLRGGELEANRSSKGGEQAEKNSSVANRSSRRLRDANTSAATERSQVNTQGSRASFNTQTGTTENIENYLTPEYIRRAKRMSSLGVSAHQSLYQSKIMMEMVAEGGTQTTPTLSVLHETDEKIESILLRNRFRESTAMAVQVTPGLVFAGYKQLVKSTGNSPINSNSMGTSPINQSNIKSTNNSNTSNNQSKRNSNFNLDSINNTNRSRRGDATRSRNELERTECDQQNGTNSDMETIPHLSEQDIQEFKDQFAKLEAVERDCIHTLESSAPNSAKRETIQNEIQLIRTHKDILKDMISTGLIPVTPVPTSAPSNPISAPGTPINSAPGTPTNASATPNRSSRASYVPSPVIPSIHQPRVDTDDKEVTINTSKFNHEQDQEELVGERSAAETEIEVPEEAVAAAGADGLPQLDEAAREEAVEAAGPLQVEEAAREEAVEEELENEIEDADEELMETEEEEDKGQPQLGEEDEEVDDDLETAEGHQGAPQERETIANIQAFLENSYKSPGVVLGSPPSVEVDSSTPRVEEHSSTPRVEEHSSTPRVEEHSSTPRVEEHSSTPRVEEHSSTPRVEEQVDIPREGLSAVHADIEDLQAGGSGRSSLNSRDRKKMRQSTLERYLSPSSSAVLAGLSYLDSPQQSDEEPAQPVKPKRQNKKPPSKPTGKRAELFPLKYMKWVFQRGSRYPLPKDCEEPFMDFQNEWNLAFRKRCSQLALERGDDVIRLSDMRQSLAECNLIKHPDEDPGNWFLYAALHETKEPQYHDLIPSNHGGVIRPPKDIWDVKIIKGKEKRRSIKKPSTSNIKRHKTSRDLDSTESEGEPNTTKPNPTKPNPTKPHTSKARKRSSKGSAKKSSYSKSAESEMDENPSSSDVPKRKSSGGTADEEDEVFHGKAKKQAAKGAAKKTAKKVPGKKATKQTARKSSSGQDESRKSQGGSRSKGPGGSRSKGPGGSSSGQDESRKSRGGSSSEEMFGKINHQKTATSIRGRRKGK